MLFPTFKKVSAAKKKERNTQQNENVLQIMQREWNRKKSDESLSQWKNKNNNRKR